MLNLHFRTGHRLDAASPRVSRAGFLFYTRGRQTDCLTPWPELASYRRHAFVGPEWQPCAQAADRVFAAYCVPEQADYGLASGRLCEAETGQSLMTELLTERADREQEVFARVRHQWWAFERLIPPSANQIVARFRRRPIALLRLLAVCPEAAALAEENAAVFFELACHFDRPATDHTLRDEILRRLHGPQRDILHLRGLAATEAARRLFRKLPARDVCSRRLHLLGRALADPKVGRWLPHFDPLNRHVAAVLEDEALWPYLSGQLVNELLRGACFFRGFGQDGISDFWIDGVTTDNLRRLRWFHRQVKRGAAKPRPFHTAGELKSLPGLPACLQDHEFTVPRLDFPPPPFPGTAEVVPITTAEALAQEGQDQKNCAGAYDHVQRVSWRKAYFYRVLAPERCTVMIELRPGKPGRPTWQITELRAYNNAIPLRATMQAVADALQMPAAPAWHPERAWWLERRGLAWVPIA